MFLHQSLDGLRWGRKYKKGLPLSLFSASFCVSINQLPHALVTTSWSPAKYFGLEIKQKDNHPEIRLKSAATKVALLEK